MRTKWHERLTRGAHESASLSPSSPAAFTGTSSASAATPLGRPVPLLSHHAAPLRQWPPCTLLLRRRSSLAMPLLLLWCGCPASCLSSSSGGGRVVQLAAAPGRRGVREGEAVVGAERCRGEVAAARRRGGRVGRGEAVWRRSGSAWTRRGGGVELRGGGGGQRRQGDDGGRRGMETSEPSHRVPPFPGDGAAPNLMGIFPGRDGPVPAVKAKVQVAAASSVTMVSHTCASPSAVRKKRTVKKNVDSIEGACGGDQAAGMEFDCAGSVRGGGAAGAYGQVVQRPTQGTKSPMSSISLNLGRLSMPERDCILVKAQINFSSFGVDPLVKLILVILEQLTIRWLSFRNSALLKDLSKSSRQRMFDFFESFWKSPCLSNVPRRVTLAICMALSRNECNMLLLSSLVAMLLLLLLLLLFTSSSLSFGRSSTPERDCRLVKRKVIFSSSGAAPFSKNMPVMLQLSVRKYSRHLNLSSLKLGKRVETILIQLGATKSYLGKLIFIFSQQCLKKLHFLLSRTLGGCFRLKPLSAAGDPLLEVFPKRISPLQRPETLMQVTARIKFLRDPYAEEFLGHAWNQISVTSQKTLQFQENEMLCRRCMHLCLTDIRRELLEEFVDVVRAAKVDIVEDGEMTSQGVVQLVQFFIASHGVSVQSMSEYPHAEFMILAFLQDVVNNLGAGVAIILMLACKLEHCIMVESNKRIFYRLSLWWIAIIFGLLDALCVGDD
ncbi:hypothetical protein U9M48_031158 [Paspalum notatum var. saurae]|uniref:Uncharacterized protein n=1 Tax=Paspalum notatum var. saurae TaxID=547442 RepID=A0AAQ3U2G4_PASNO